MNRRETHQIVENPPVSVLPHTPVGPVEPAAAVPSTSGDGHAMYAGSRIADEHTMCLPDGTQLFYRHWPALKPSHRTVVLFHRGHEHSGRLQDLVDRLDLPDAHLIAPDARGHGRSPGERGYAPSYGVMVRDVDQFVRALSQRHDLPIDRMTVLAHSVGAVAVAAWVHDYHPPIRGMALISPALRVKLYVPLAIPGLRLLSKFKRRFNVRSYVSGKMLTHDSDMAASYDSDPLVSRSIAVNILLGLHDTSRRLLADADAIVTPTLILTAGSDWVVRNDAIGRFYDRLSSPVKTLKRYDGMYHSLLHERDRARPIADLRAFIEQCDSDQTPRLSPRPRVIKQYEQLRRPAPLWQRPWWWMQRLGLNTVCRLSRGIRIGGSDGFDSGRSLDHVYRNRAQGAGPLGRLIDRVYLNAPGWQGIRRRKRNMHGVLTAAISRVRQSQGGVHVMDIASGPGRYLLDVIAERSSNDITATLRDCNEAGLADGRSLAERMGLSDHVRYESGDAFDEPSLSRIEPRPDIAVVSGLYELFADNAMIARSLRGLHQAVRDGGYLIYTNQPWHPQLTMIARTLRNRDGEAWVMRCRSQAEMDQLVADAGFVKLETHTDDDGIFTVSLARKVNR
jgi:alpha-beta hydrolase superfamily lysophospholipase/SAM-dependent methyltransferase